MYNFEEQNITTPDAQRAVSILSSASLISKIIEKINKAFSGKISQDELKKILLSGDEVEVFATKLDGSTLHRKFVKTIDGPEGKAMWGCRYWDNTYNYMILWSNTDTDFRTIVLRKVDKIKVNGKTYYVK